MKKFVLQAKSRDVFGKKVKTLRAEGVLPATVYGKNVESVSVVVGYEDFEKVFDEAGETGVIDLQLTGGSRPVLIHNVQLDPVKGTMIHVEFYQVNLKEKVKAEVPVVLIGESPAVRDKIGVLLTVLDEVEVEALPNDLPEKMELDISVLENLNQELSVRDLVPPKNVELLTDPNLTVVKISSLLQKEEVAPPEAQAPETVEDESAPVESAGDQTPTEETKEDDEG